MDPYYGYANRYRRSLRNRKPYGNSSKWGQRGRKKFVKGSLTASRFGRRRYNARAFALNPATQGLLGIEKKFIDVPRTGFTLLAPTDATGGIVVPTSVITGCLTAPAQGDGPTNRDGNKIVVCEVGVSGVIAIASQAAATAADTLCEIFVCLVQDTQTNGAAFTSEQVWQNPCASSVTATNLFRNMSFVSRFKVLKMKTIRLTMPTMAGISASLEQAGQNKTFKMKWKGKMPVTFTTASTTADVANVTDNSINVVAFTNNTSLAPFLLFNCRTRFYG